MFSFKFIVKCLLSFIFYLLYRIAFFGASLLIIGILDSSFLISNFDILSKIFIAFFVIVDMYRTLFCGYEPFNFDLSFLDK